MTRFANMFNAFVLQGTKREAGVAPALIHHHARRMP